MSTEIENTEYEHTEHKLTLRNLQASDYADIKRIMEVVYHSAGGALPENIAAARASSVGSSPSAPASAAFQASRRGAFTGVGRAAVKNAGGRAA